MTSDTSPAASRDEARALYERGVILRSELRAAAGFPTGTRVRSFRLGPIAGSWSPGSAWFRVFGVGLHVRDTDRHPLRFSERNGYTRLWTIETLR